LFFTSRDVDDMGHVGMTWRPPKAAFIFRQRGS
jgi:hypothetical protein